MFIVPLQGLQSINEIGKKESVNTVPTGEGTQLPFKDIFQNAIENIKETDAIKKEDAMNLALGNTDDLHNIIINMDKAQTAVDFAVEIRNKALDAYNEIMRMSV